MINTNYLFIMALISGWNILGSKWTFVPKVDVLEAGKVSQQKELSKFDQGQIVMARWLVQGISNTAAVVDCPRSAVVNIYKKWSKEGTCEHKVMPDQCSWTENKVDTDVDNEEYCKLPFLQPALNRHVSNNTAPVN